MCYHLFYFQQPSPISSVEEGSSQSQLDILLNTFISSQILKPVRPLDLINIFEPIKTFKSVQYVKPFKP